MIGKTNRRFWKHFDALPAKVQKLAREKYALWKRYRVDHRGTLSATPFAKATAVLGD